ncbi:MAG: hypothetical protein M1496_05780 [Candidatus Thermoplasmatota archaeon]|nr:hypothetical protein [Candidatus Thermoplasmatota archaeon]
MNDKIMKNRKIITAMLVVIIMASLILPYEVITRENEKITSFDCSTKLINYMGKKYPGLVTPAEYTNVYNGTLHSFCKVGSKEEYLNTTLNFTCVCFTGCNPQINLFFFDAHFNINYSYKAPVYLRLSCYNQDWVSNTTVFKIPCDNNSGIVSLHSIDSTFACIGKVCAVGSYNKGMNLTFSTHSYSNYSEFLENANYELQIYLSQNIYTTYFISMKAVNADSNNREVFYHNA